jgi:hypothetical protein
MRFGHFIAIILFFLTILFGFMFYWDLQDGEFSNKSLSAPIFTFFLMVTLMLFPGNILTKETKSLTDYEPKITPFRIKIVITMFVIMLYLYFWAESFFTGEVFFSFGRQCSLLLSFLVIFFIFRRYIKR